MKSSLVLCPAAVIAMTACLVSGCGEQPTPTSINAVGARQKAQWVRHIRDSIDTTLGGRADLTGDAVTVSLATIRPHEQYGFTCDLTTRIQHADASFELDFQAVPCNDQGLFTSLGRQQLLAQIAQKRTDLEDTFRVFATPHVMAVQVEVLDATETPLFSNAELYLDVQFSSFPNSTRLLVPVNVGPYGGSQERFIELPFLPEPKDTVIFQLLDEDELSEEEEKLIVDACEVAGCVIWKGAEVLAPKLGLLLSKDDTDRLKNLTGQLGPVLVQNLRQHKFDYCGKAEYLVQTSPPKHPRDANRLTIKDGTHAYADVKVYFVEKPSQDKAEAKPGPRI